jgi:hypothetical protein
VTKVAAAVPPVLLKRRRALAAGLMCDV